jgi:hypothetical protein
MGVTLFVLKPLKLSDPSSQLSLWAYSLFFGVYSIFHMFLGIFVGTTIEKAFPKVATVWLIIFTAIAFVVSIGLFTFLVLRSGFQWRH